MQAKIERIFRKAAMPCQFVPTDTAQQPAPRWISLGNNKVERASSDNYVSEPILLASFLLSEGTPQSGDRFMHNGEYFQLTQLYLVDEYTATWIYI
jgi:hypothetical protein